MIDLSQYTFGKIPPQANDVEEMVLGSILIENCLSLVSEILVAEDFYLPTNQKIYQACIELFATSKPIDIISVCEQLKNKGFLEDAGGVYYVNQLTTRVASSAHIEHHARIIKQKSISRQLIGVSSEVIRDCYEDTVDELELLDRATMNLIRLRNGIAKNKTVHISKIANDNLQQIINLSSGKIKHTGIISGIDSLDKVIGAFQKGCVYTVAGRPGMGKSALVTSLLNNISIEQKIASGFFSLEMSNEQTEYRLKCIRTNINYHRISHGNIFEGEWEKLNNETKEISNSPIYIDDTGGLNIVELRSKAINLKTQFNIQILFVDFLQRMKSIQEKGKITTRANDVTDITREIATLAKELDIPIIQLSQLNRTLEDTKLKIPELHHLKESGSIEEDSYCVIFVYRPEYYKIDYFEDGISTIDKAELIVAKHRNGDTGTIRLNYNKDIMYFNESTNHTEMQSIPFDEPIKKRGTEESFKF